MCASCGPIENSARGSASVESRERTYARSVTLTSSAGPRPCGARPCGAPVLPRRHSLTLASTLGAFAQDTGYAPPRERRHALNGDVGATFAHVAITSTDGYDGASGNARHVERGSGVPVHEGVAARPRRAEGHVHNAAKSADLRSPIGSDRARFGLPADAPVTSGYEAGEGFWLHRYLEAHGIRSLAGRRGSLRLRQLDSCVLGTASAEVAR